METSSPDYAIARFTKAQKATYAGESCVCGNPVTHAALIGGEIWAIACAFCAHRWKRSMMTHPSRQ